MANVAAVSTIWIGYASTGRVMLQGAERVECEAEAAMHFIPHGLRHAKFASWAGRQKARGDIHAIAMQIAALGDSVPDARAHPEANALLRRPACVEVRHSILQLDGAPQGHERRKPALARTCGGQGRKLLGKIGGG